MLLLDKTVPGDGRDWYAAQAVEEGWSRPVLKFQIDTDLRRRLGSATSNFARALTPPDSDLAQGMTKDPLVFQHLGLTKPLTEHDLEEALTNRIQDTLLELGQLGAYVAVVDDLLRRPGIHAPTVGLLLCQGKNEAWVRYALVGMASSVAVADWQGLPRDARATLPSAEELQAVVDDEFAVQRAARAAREAANDETGSAKAARSRSTGEETGRDD
jgi:hypothetical protein